MRIADVHFAAYRMHQNKQQVCKMRQLKYVFKKISFFGVNLNIETSGKVNNGLYINKKYRFFCFCAFFSVIDSLDSFFLASIVRTSNPFFGKNLLLCRYRMQTEKKLAEKSDISCFIRSKSSIKVGDGQLFKRLSGW